MLFFASDHAAVELKTSLYSYAHAKKIEVKDFGPSHTHCVDYPDYANKLCEAMINNPCAKGILICGSGIGMSIAANRYRHIRAALVHDVRIAKLARLHNNANVLCFGSRVIDDAIAKDMLDIFLETDFEGGRHQRRVDKLS